MKIIELVSANIEEYLPSCLELQAALVSDPSTIVPERLLATAHAPESYFICIVDEDGLVGLGVVSRITHPVHITGYINNIVVGPQARGKGYFSVIMDELERKAKVWGCDEVALTCSRPPVQAMYEKRNYVQKDTNYYRLTLQ